MPRVPLPDAVGEAQPSVVARLGASSPGARLTSTLSLEATQLSRRHVVDSLAHFNRSEILPVVMVKDPLTWARSMCRNAYAARFKKDPKCCPSPLDMLTARDHPSLTNGNSTVTVPFRLDRPERYESLLNLWSTWYGESLRIERDEITLEASAERTRESSRGSSRLQIALGKQYISESHSVRVVVVVVVVLCVLLSKVLRESPAGPPKKAATDVSSSLGYTLLSNALCRGASLSLSRRRSGSLLPKARTGIRTCRG